MSIERRTVPPLRTIFSEPRPQPETGELPPVQPFEIQAGAVVETLEPQTLPEGVALLAEKQRKPYPAQGAEVGALLANITAAKYAEEYAAFAKPAAPVARRDFPISHYIASGTSSSEQSSGRLSGFFRSLSSATQGIVGFFPAFFLELLGKPQKVTISEKQTRADRETLSKAKNTAEQV